MTGFVIENPDRDLMFLLQVRARLQLMIAHPGGRWKISPISATNKKYHTSFRRAAPCLDFVNAQLEKRKEELRAKV